MIHDAVLATWEGRDTEHWRTAWGLPVLVILERTASTNDVARSLAEDGADAFTTILAEEQTAGRGRFGRAWKGDAQNSLLFSILLRPRPGTPTAPTAPLRIGLAVALGLERATGVVLGLKWPNDVLAPDGAKLAGVLCEGAVLARDGAAYVIAGVGINVNQTREDWPPELRELATSLRQILGAPQPRAPLVATVLEEIRRQAPHLGDPLDEDGAHTYHLHDRLFGRPVQVDGAPAGIARGITPEGALRIRGPDSERLVWSGTIRIDPGHENTR